MNDLWVGRFITLINQLFCRHVTMSKTKKPQFKNPFDLAEDDEDEIIQVQPVYASKSNTTVHNPLPFNPYQTKPISESKPQKTKATLDHKPGVVQASKRIPAPIYAEQVPTRDTDENIQAKVGQLNEDGDPPLLEDIGIEPALIKDRIIMILKLQKPSDEVIEDPDLSGPILIALCFGLLLLLSGKIHFGDIYAIFVVGNLLLYFLFNYMSQIQIIPLYSIMSTVGYALLPMLIVGFFGIFLSLKGAVGILLSLAVAGWSSLAASNFVEALMKQTTSDRKFLLMYPLFLFYVCFALIIIF